MHVTSVVRYSSYDEDIYLLLIISEGLCHAMASNVKTYYRNDGGPRRYSVNNFVVSRDCMCVCEFVMFIQDRHLS